MPRIAAANDRQARQTVSDAASGYGTAQSKHDVPTGETRSELAAYA